MTALTNYNSTALVNSGVAHEVAHVDVLNQTASIAKTTVYAVPASGEGFYRVSWIASINRAATTSSTLGLFRTYATDPLDSQEKMWNPVVGYTSLTANAITSCISGVQYCYCKASTNLGYAIDYTSVGATTMRYDLHITVEKM